MNIVANIDLNTMNLSDLIKVLSHLRTKQGTKSVFFSTTTKNVSPSIDFVRAKHDVECFVDLGGKLVIREIKVK